MITLIIGFSETRYLIHSQILQKSAPLYALVKDHMFFAPELDDHLTHPLFHYLYSGTLEWTRSYPKEEKFSISTRMYFAAIQYELPGLVELAKGEIIRSGEELDILSILLSVKRNISLPHLDSDVWYWQNLEDVIQSAMEKNPEPFKRPDFITKIQGNSRLLQIVWNTLMSSFASVSASRSSVHDLDNRADTLLVARSLTESEVTTPDSLHQPPSPIKSVVRSPPVLEQADDLIEPQKLELDASISTDQHTIAHPEPEQPVSDTVDDNNNTSISDTESPASQSQAVQIVSVPVKNIQEPEHTRADSVVAEDAVAPVGLKKKNKMKSKSKKKKEPPAAV